MGRWAYLLWMIIVRKKRLRKLRKTMLRLKTLIVICVLSGLDFGGLRGANHFQPWGEANPNSPGKRDGWQSIHCRQRFPIGCTFGVQTGYASALMKVAQILPLKVVLLVIQPAVIYSGEKWSAHPRWLAKLQWYLHFDLMLMEVLRSFEEQESSYRGIFRNGRLVLRFESSSRECELFFVLGNPREVELPEREYLKNCRWDCTRIRSSQFHYLGRGWGKAS